MSTPDSGQPGPESSSPPHVRTCPHCGAVLPADAPEGQCPACLLQNLTLEPSPTSATQPAEAPKPPSPPLSPAEIAPHFPQLEILECLGRGGMGVVYKARQKSLNRLVALKLLAPEREKDAAFAERFTREAQALALLSHSHIVTVYDFGITGPSSENAGDGFYYLLMEYVDGVNLRQLLDQRKLTPEEALAIVPSLCDALQFAHERGIVHRDIKPENLLLDRRGQVKIADFGIAKMMGNGTPSYTAASGAGAGASPSDAAAMSPGVTQPQTALGTPAYMAPEQASAPERVDSRADIYSLGVVFYEMLTGELPAKQIEATTSRLKNLHIDVRVDEIVLRALEKKPEMRWQTAAELRTRIESVTAPPALPPTPPPNMPPAPASPTVATPPGFGLTAVAAATVYAYILAFLVKLFELGHGSDRFALAVFLVTWGVSISIVHHLLTRKRLSDDAVRRWLGISSICGWIIALPMAGLAIFFLMAMFEEGSRWNPGAMEAVMVPLICLGALLLPLAAWCLWRASGRVPSSTSRPRPQGWRLVFGLLFLAATVGIPLLGIMLYSLNQSRTQVVYHQKKSILQQRVLIEQSNLDDLSQSEQELQNKYLQAPPSEAVGLSHSLNDQRTIIAQTRKGLEKLKRELERLRPPAPAFGPPVPAVWIVGSVLCLIAAMVLFWMRAPTGAGYGRFFLFALPVLALGYVTVMLVQIVSSRSVALRPPLEVEVPFAYNWTVRGNVLLVNLTVSVRGDQVEGRVLLRGNALDSSAQAKALQAYHEPIALPGWPDREQPRQTFYRGTGEWQIAFALPDAEMAKEAGRNLRPMGLLTPGPGAAAAILFQVSSEAHGVYQGEIQFGTAGNLAPDGEIESAIPGMTAPVSSVPEVPLNSPLRAAAGIHQNQTIDPPVMDTSDAALRSLSRQAFDQTPGQYWRQLADVRRFREAAELIERYLALHPELDEAGRHVEGADLHFHAAQCHAFAGNKEKALEHLTKARHVVFRPKDGGLWNYYVEGTEAFLREDRPKLVQMHNLLVRDSSQNSENLLVIERLLAGFGKSYAEAYESDANADHAKLSADFFNRAWELLDKPKRIPEEDAQMLAYSHASLAHWRMRSDVKPRNFSIAYWQLSRIYAVLGQGDNAATYAQLCRFVTYDGIPRQELPFYGAYAEEAMARAARLRGDGMSYYPAMRQAKAMLKLIENPSERELVEKDLKELESSPPPVPKASSMNDVNQIYTLKHVSMDSVVSWVKTILQIGQGRESPFGSEGYAASPDNRTLAVRGRVESRYRVAAYLVAVDVVEPLFAEHEAGSPVYRRYLRSTPMNTARAFLHACATRDLEGMESLMDTQALADLRDQETSARARHLRGLLGLTAEELEKRRSQPGSDVPEDPRTEWEKLGEALHDDWPKKQEALNTLARQWTQYSMDRLSLLNPQGDSTADVEVLYHDLYDGSPSPKGLLSIALSDDCGDGQRGSITKSSPPETNASPGSILTE